jgi:DNA-binding transcriptional regulator YiaG
LLVKAIWLGQSHGNTHTPVGRLWDVLVTPDGEFDWQTGTINPPYAIGLTISPGLWISDFLHRGERKAEVVLYQFSYCALHLLKLHPDDSEFAIRLVIHLRLDARLQACDSRPYEYQVQSLLSAVLPESLLHQIQESSEVARFWFDRWNRVLGLLGTLGWHTDESRLLPDRDLESVTRFYTKPYPKWLEPDSDQRRPRGWVDCWLGQTLVLRPPVLLPEQMSALIHGSREQHSLLKLSRPYQLTGAEVKAARQSRKLTQSELAELLQVHQSLIARIESGDRAISPAIEALLRKTLELS